MDKDVQIAYSHLQEYLVKNFDAKYAAGKKEVTKRCHLCGDSRTKSSRHMYIGINKSGQISYHCFLCGGGGIIDAKFFRDLNVYDTSIVNEVLEANKNASKYNYSQNNLEGYNRRLQSPIITYSDPSRTQFKMNYIERRLGINIPPEYYARFCQEFKVIPNILEFLSANNIPINNRNMAVMNQINDCFVGFLSCDNACIIMRRLVEKDRLHPSLQSRYIKYNIYADYQGRSSYIIPASIDRFKPAHIVMAEGPFDILSIYVNKIFPYKDNVIYGCAGGKTGYQELFRYILSRGASYYNVDIHIYSDNDITPQDRNNFRYQFKQLNIFPIIHFNRYGNEKDFGVPKSNIMDYSEYL